MYDIVSFRRYMCLFFATAHLFLVGCSDYATNAPPLPEIADEKRIVDLVRDIDKAPYDLHAEYTPSVEKLIEIGPECLPFVIKVYETDKLNRRMYAVMVMTSILDMWADQNADGSLSPDERKTLAELYRKLGDPSEGDTLEERISTAKRWREWATRQLKSPPKGNWRARGS